MNTVLGFNCPLIGLSGLNWVTGPTGPIFNNEELYCCQLIYLGNTGGNTQGNIGEFVRVVPSSLPNLAGVRKLNKDPFFEWAIQAGGSSFDQG